MRHPHLSADPRLKERRAVLLVSHGSRDPRAAFVVSRLLAALAARTGEEVRASHLDFTTPAPDVALRQLAEDGFEQVRVVPLLFTPGYHVSHDVPAAIAASGVGDRLDITVAPALLDSPARDGILAALVERLSEATSLAVPGGVPGVRDVDGVVLAAAGSSSTNARSYVEQLALDLARLLGRPTRPAYASAAVPTVADAIHDLRREGVRRPAVASLFVAPGRLPDAVGRSAGGHVVADPLGVTPAFVRALARLASAEALTPS